MVVEEALNQQDASVTEEEREEEEEKKQPSPYNMKSPGVSTQKTQESLFMEKFGLTSKEMARAKSLRQLGVSEEDLVIAEKLIREMPPTPTRASSKSKAELVLGYDQARLDRKKAMDVLGITEEHLDDENTKNLGALGIDGRRRSKDGIRVARSMSEPAMPRRRSSMLNMLRRISGANNTESDRPMSTPTGNSSPRHRESLLTKTRRRLSLPSSPKMTHKFGFDCTKSFGDVDDNNSSPEYVAAMTRQKLEESEQTAEKLALENRELKRQIEMMEKQKKVAELEKQIVEMEKLQAEGVTTLEGKKEGNLKDDSPEIEDFPASLEDVELELKKDV